MLLGLTGFAVGLIPLLALTFFSPGLRSEGAWAVAVFVLGVLTGIALVASARRLPALWILVALQALLLIGVLYQTLSGSRLYIGT